MLYGKVRQRTLALQIFSTGGNMSASLKESPCVDLRLQAVALVLTAATLLAGCVVQARVPPPPPPPPPRVYVPPPPPAPADEAPDADVAVQVAEPPPPLPDYEQPPIPAEGYLWTPGYWAYANGGYYWVPGTWVQPPSVGVLWTPGYWGFVGGFYAFNPGYWGPHVGFYGGVNYGYGYVGVGFAGGRWEGNSFAYNRSVTNITNVTVVHNTYNETVINNNTTRVSYNGGATGIKAAPTPAERAVAHESHVPPTPLQRQHINQAAKNPALFARANGGHPPIAATPRPAAFHAPGVVGAHGAATPPPHAGPVRHDNVYTGKAPPSAQQRATVHTPVSNVAPRPQGAAPHTNAKAAPQPAPNPKTPPPARQKKEPESNNKQ
jgi:hypothetical protein